MKRTTIGSNILVKIYEQEKKTGAGLILPETAQEGNASVFIGKVLACGPDCKQVKEGDVVTFGAASLLLPFQMFSEVNLEETEKGDPVAHVTGELEKLVRTAEEDIYFIIENE